MNSLVGLGATASFAVSAVAALLPQLGEEPGKGRGRGGAGLGAGRGSGEWNKGALAARHVHAESCLPLLMDALLGCRHTDLPCMPGWRTFFEEPAMLLGVVLVGRALEERAKLQASADMAALQAGGERAGRAGACGAAWARGREVLLARARCAPCVLTPGVHDAARGPLASSCLFLRGDT